MFVSRIGSLPLMAAAQTTLLCCCDNRTERSRIIILTLQHDRRCINTNCSCCIVILLWHQVEVLNRHGARMLSAWTTILMTEHVHCMSLDHWKATEAYC